MARPGVLKSLLWPVVVALLLGTIFALALSPASIFDTTKNVFACDVTSNIILQTGPNGRPSIWDTRYTFAASYGFGGLSFSSVKAIDVCWDLLVGRGGQVLLLALFYTVFRPATHTLLSTGALPHEQILAMQYSPASLWTLRTVLGHSVASRRSSKTHQMTIEADSRSSRQRGFYRLYTLALIFSTMFLLAFPTWLSAMTLYQASSFPVLPTGTGDFMTIDSPKPCAMVIFNGEVIGLQEKTCVFESTALYNSMQQLMESGSFCTGSPIHGAYCQSGPPTIFHHDGKTYHLEAWQLNFYVDPDDVRRFWSIANKTVKTVDVLNQGVCQPGRTYQWGFSFLLLFSFLVVSFVLACLICVVQYQCGQLQRASKYWQISPILREQEDRLFGHLSTAVEVVASIRIPEVDSVRGLTDEDMRQALRKKSAWMTYNRRAGKLEET